jgi:hypothetical protein
MLGIAAVRVCRVGNGAVSDGLDGRVRSMGGVWLVTDMLLNAEERSLGR